MLFMDVGPLEAGLQRYREVFESADRDNTASKLGLEVCTDSDAELMQALLDLLHEGEVDMTLFFRGLADLDAAQPSLEPVEESFYDDAKRQHIQPALMQWLQRYAQRLAQDPLDAAARKARMNAANPRFVLRNYLAQQVIDRAHEGDESGVAELLEVMRHPYDEQPGREAFAARRPDWARDRAGCSMLSCSS